MGPFDRFNDRAKRVLALAHDEALRLHHDEIRPEHLLLGSLRVLGEDAGGIAARVLAALGISLDRIRQEVVNTIGPQVPPAPAGPPQPFDAEGMKRDWYCQDVLSGKLEVRKLYEDERVLGFEHPYPQYLVHGVVVPKTHVPSLLSVEALDPELLRSMLLAVQSVARALGLDTKGFRVEVNAAAPGVTPHMHWHVAGPGLPPPPLGRTAGRWVSVTAAMPFDRLSDAGKRVLALAQDEAIRLDHNYVGTEHLLAGILREDGLASQVLGDLGVEITKVRTALEFIIGRGARPTTPSEITLSPRTKKAIELAIDEARRMRQATVGSAELLLGLVREGEGIASGILESLGVSLETVRNKMVERLGRQPPPPPPPASPPS